MIKQIIGLLFILISLHTFAQRNNTSPYSFFGIGETTGSKTVEEIGMGQIGSAFNSSYQLSFTNPASYSFLRFTNFNLAGQNIALQIDDGTNTDKGSNASFSYLALGLPLGNNAGLVFGLKPNTSVGYSLTKRLTDASGNLTAIDLFSGNGGTNEVFLGFGHKIGKNFSAGIEASYVFGSIENSLLNRPQNCPGCLATMQKSDSDVRGFTLKTGVQYQTKVSEKLTLKTGAVLELSNDLTNKGTEYRFSLLNVANGAVIPRDTTLVRPFDIRFKTPTRTTLSAGIGEENKWHAGIEYSFQNALSFDDGLSANNNFKYTNSNRISVGGFYTPKFNSVTNYWQRATYRAGLKLEKTGLEINNTSINDFGISFGIGLPIGRQLSQINFGFELGQRGTTDNGLIKENYLNFRVGLSLTDKWFRKRKLD